MTALAGRVASALGLPDGIIEAVIVIANFLLSALIFAAIFKFVPSVFVTWRAAAAGGLFTAVLFALGRFALAWYLGREAEASAYGAATSLVLLLIWVYYSAQILFLGAQFSQSFQNERLDTVAASERMPVDNSRDQVAPDNYVSTVAAALSLGFLLGALAMQKPRSRRRLAEPGLLQRASRLLAIGH